MPVDLKKKKSIIKKLKIPLFVDNYTCDYTQEPNTLRVLRILNLQRKDLVPWTSNEYFNETLINLSRLATFIDILVVPLSFQSFLFTGLLRSLRRFERQVT